MCNMKLAITLVVIAAVLLVDGGMRIILGFAQGNAIALIGGILTGVVLGGYLLYRGIKRMKRTWLSRPNG